MSLVKGIGGAGGWRLLGGKGVCLNGEDGTLNDNVFRNGQPGCTMAPSWDMLARRPGVFGFEQRLIGRTAVFLGSLQVAFWCFLMLAYL